MVQDEILKLKFDNSCGGKLFATQTDTGRTFTVQILSDRNEIVDVTGMSLRLYIGNQKEVTYCDGEIVDAEKGIFKLQLFNSQLKYPGIQQAQFILKKDDKKIGSKIFDIYVEEGVEAGSSMGTNLVIMYDEIKEAVEFLKVYNKTLEDAKKVDASLKSEIKESAAAKENLAECKKKALEIKGQLDKSKVDANKTLTNLKTTKTESENLKSNLTSENQKATSNIKDLTNKIDTGKTTTSELNKSITDAKANKTNLDKSNSVALSTKKSLEDVTTAAKTTKENLSNLKSQGETLSGNLTAKITDGNKLKSNLVASTSNAENAKSSLDTSVETATSTNTSLTATDTEAKKTESLIRDLINQLDLSKDEINKIIANGDLSKYITEPKLEEELKDYAKKEDALTKLDTTTYATDEENNIYKVTAKIKAGQLENELSNVGRRILNDFYTKSIKITANQRVTFKAKSSEKGVVLVYDKDEIFKHAIHVFGNLNEYEIAPLKEGGDVELIFATVTMPEAEVEIIDFEVI